MSQYKPNFKDHDYVPNESHVQACRLCLNTETALFSINEYNLKDSIKLLTGITATTNDKLPQYICNCCKYLLKKFMKFRKRCLNAHDALSRITLMKIEITTDLIRTIDRASLNLTLSLDRADEIIDCLNNDYIEIAVPKQENDTEDSCDPLESHDEIHITDKSEIQVLDNQSKLPEDKSDNFLKIVIDRISSVEDPVNLEATSNFNTPAKNLRGKAEFSTETFNNDAVYNMAIGDVNEQNEDEELAITSDSSSECGVSVAKIIAIQNEIDNDETHISNNESEEEQEEFPEARISKETYINLEIKLPLHLKKILENFFYKQIKYRKLLTEEKACQLERVRKVLEYNGYDFSKYYEDEDLQIGGKLRKLNADSYIWVSTEKKRAEFEEQFNIKVKILTKEQQAEEFKARALSANYNRKLFKCGICYTGFMLEKLYIAHLDVHKPTHGKYECSLCHYRFSRLFNYRVHLLQHKSKFFCKQCSYSTNSLVAAKSHYDGHKGRRFKCKYCPTLLNARSTYFAHMKLRHASELVPCDVCGETFSGENGLRNHMSRTHEVVGLRSNSSKCITCGVRFNNVKAMKKHTSAWQDGVCQPTVKSCIECGKNFETEELLTAHSVIHAKTLACEMCGMRFVSQTSLNIHHQRKHLNIVEVSKKNYYKYPTKRKSKENMEERECLKVICEYCGKTLSTKYHLQDHINIHLGRKPYKCNLCNKSYGTKLSLKCHLAIHTGEQFICDVCGAVFHNGGNLKRHIDVVHTGIKRFQCDICFKKFGCKASVSLHIRTVHMKLPHPPRKKRNRSAAVKRRKLANYSTTISSDLVVHNESTHTFTD